VTAKYSLRKKALLDISVWHLCQLGFVNAFGYLLPTLYMLRKGQLSVFEYLFNALYLDLIFTIILSLIYLRRVELQTFKIILPLALCLFGLAFHETATFTTLPGSTSGILTVQFSPSLITKGSLYQSRYYYIYLVSRLSKCFVTVASKSYLLKEQASRKCLAASKYAATPHKHQAGSFVQVNKKSLLFRRAILQEQYG
jgi:hypothetical protein